MPSCDDVKLSHVHPCGNAGKAMKAIEAGRPLFLRSPRATRPWQLVLEPLSGYLWLGARLLLGMNEPFNLRGQAYNFGPAADVKAVRIQRMNGQPVLREHPVHGLPKVGQGVEQRSVHVKNNSLEIHDPILRTVWLNEKAIRPPGPILSPCPGCAR